MADRTVYVGNVGATVDESMLRSIFENCGLVTQVRMAGKKGYDTVYCFVEFADAQQAITALAMNGLQLGDRQIRVSMAKAPARSAPEQRQGNDFMAINLIQAQAQARLMQLPAFNMLLPMSGVQTPAALKTKRPHQDPDKVIRTVFVENVDDGMDEQGLAEYFNVCGQVTAVRLAGATGNKKAWIEFGSKESARSAREYDNTVLGSATVRVRPSKTAIHTNGLQREQDSNSGSKTPSPSRTGDTNSPGGSQSQARTSSRHSDRHAEVAQQPAQQPAQLRSHGQSHSGGSGSPPLAQPALAVAASAQMSGAQQGQVPPVQMGPSPAEIQQHLMANMSHAMIPQHQPQPMPQQQAMHQTNAQGYGGAPASVPMMHAHPQPHALQQAGYHPMPARSAAAGPRMASQSCASSGPSSGRASPSLNLKRGYEDVQQHNSANANAAAAAAAFLNKQQQQQQQEDKRMRMTH